MQVTDPLAPLHAWPQWILVKLVPRAGGKTDKLPVDPRTMQVTERGSGGAHDPAIWLPHATAAALLPALPGHILGFVLTAADPFWCLDIDGALLPSGQWSPLAQELTQALPGAACEVSQSGKGLHIWGQGPVPEHAKKNTALQIELYTELRFIALGLPGATGAMLPECPGIAAVAERYFPPAGAAGAGASGGVPLPAEGPRADWRGPTDDEDLIRRMLRTRSAAAVLGGRATAADLWEGNADTLARSYPSTTEGEPYDASSADLALAQHLAFWTGCDLERMRTLMWESQLQRPKWEREDYLNRTLQRACAQQQQVCQDAPIEPAAAIQAAVAGYTGALPEMTPVSGSTMLYAADQIKLFKGCVYIVQRHRVLVPGGRLLKPEQFRSAFGGYVFVMTADGSKTTRNAFEAFTESTVLRCPQADDVSFAPMLPYGAITEDEDGTRLANKWWPPTIPRTPGDATPFLRHLSLLFPDATDQLVVLAYIARMVQSPGIKSQWALLIQGVEGNGKTLISRVVGYCLGKRYVHWPKASKITGQFNGWMVERLAYLVEDIHTSEGSDVLEELKPMITSVDGLEIESKGVDQVNAQVCGNFIMNSNHKTALRKSRNDRRLCILFCAQQEVEDLARDGMNEQYMTALYNWLKAGGYAIVHEFLATYTVDPRFDFAASCQRAPRTTSTEDAIQLGRGRVEQEVQEAIDEGRSGFKGGWVSSHYLDALLDGIGRSGAIPRNRRRDVMRSLGYDYHPALRDGRVNNVVSPDGMKPRLFVAIGHPAASITNATDAARAYSKAQEL